MNIKALKAEAEKYRAAAQALYDAGLLVTSNEAAILAGFNQRRGFNTVLMAERRGKLANVGVGTDHLYEATAVAANWPKGPAAATFEAGGLTQLCTLVLSLRASK